jgi:hypothetical protein
MPRYGRWARISKSADNEAQSRLCEILGRELCRDLRVPDYEWWDIETEYGREKLGLNEDEIAIGAVVEVA